MIAIWLDDVRPEPEGWVRCSWPDEVIALLREHPLTEVVLSLDHDLGDDERGTGQDVLSWLEEHVALNDLVEVPEIRLHTANPVARERMAATVDSIQRLVVLHRAALK